MSCSPWKLAQVKTHTDCNKTGPKQNRQSRLTVTRSVWTDNTVDTHPTQLNQSNYTLYTGYRVNTNYTHKHTLTTDSNTHKLYTLCTHQVCFYFTSGKTDTTDEVNSSTTAGYLSLDYVSVHVSQCLCVFVSGCLYVDLLVLFSVLAWLQIKQDYR